MNPIRRAIDLLKSGQWDEAHAIAQADDTPAGTWLHGIVHMVEGDESNARYWYRRAGRPFPGMKAVEAEMQAIAAQAAGD